MWWVYFIVQAAPLLHAHRERSFFFGYCHLAIFGSIVATGAGLHVAAYYIEHHSKLDSVETVLSTAIPVLIYLLSIFTIYMYLLRTFDAFHILLVTGSAAVLVAAVALAAAGVSMAVCLLVVMFAPIIVVIGYELVGHRHAQDAVARALSHEL